ncbi:MAG: DHH family phosphoesterase, partial [Ferruginibacter sp.]|nr:DHH family phosphoesterase [Ferruginibacter sp.]
MEKRWNILPCDTNQAARLQEALNIHPTLCRLLVQRGINTFEAARDFFRPSLEKLHSPWLMKDMDLAVERIRQALDKQEKILVFGDYDVDGTTAVASMYSFLNKLSAPGTLDFYIPNRYREGYGVSRAGIEFAHENGYTLIISLDCGIKSVELIAYARTLQIDFVVCDHHLPDTVLPNAVAILNPKQPDCPYPYKELCGCGVGFKLMMALAEKLNLPDESYLEYIDLCAVAIAADIVDMTGENRILAYHGLKKINENPSTGIAAIIQQAGIKSALNIT